MKYRNYVLPVGRVFLALIFVITGMTKLTHWSATMGYMASRGLPWIPVLLAIAIVFELAGGLLIVIGYRTELVALVLFAYLVPVTLVFHSFWSLHGMEAQMQMVNFLKNVAIMGGLLTLAATSPTPVSVDAARERRHHPPGAAPSIA
jgi:putative oxidoreductase